MDDQQALEEPIQSAEALKVINSLKPNKSSGTEGLTGEFYKKFQEQLGEGGMVELFSECLARGKIPSSWLEA